MDVRGREDYFRQLQSLLPGGLAWSREPDSVLSHLLYALASELARHDARCAALLEEADPRTTSELFGEWEAWAGLPSPCMALEEQTFDERRAALIDRLTDVGGQRPQDYIDLLARFGWTVTITEFDSSSVRSRVTERLYGADWRFVWQINIPTNIQPRQFLRVNTRLNERFQTWFPPTRKPLLECVVRHRKPAHTVVRFNYYQE